jgi:hypothetical protein
MDIIRMKNADLPLVHGIIFIDHQIVTTTGRGRPESGRRHLLPAGPRVIEPPTEIPSYWGNSIED